MLDFDILYFLEDTTEFCRLKTSTVISGKQGLCEMKNVDNCVSFVLHEHGNEEDYVTTLCTVESV